MLNTIGDCQSNESRQSSPDAGERVRIFLRITTVLITTESSGIVIHKSRGGHKSRESLASGNVFAASKQKAKYSKLIPFYLFLRSAPKRRKRARQPQKKGEYFGYRSGTTEARKQWVLRGTRVSYSDDKRGLCYMQMFERIEERCFLLSRSRFQPCEVREYYVSANFYIMHRPTRRWKSLSTHIFTETLPREIYA